MNTINLQKTVEPLPKSINPKDVLNYIVALCVNEDVKKEFVDFVGEVIHTMENFDMASCTHEGHDENGMAVVSCVLKFTSVCSAKEMMRFMPVKYGRIYKVATMSFVDNTKFH